jgi:hypothetical protein
VATISLWRSNRPCIHTANAAYAIKQQHMP